MSKLTRLLFVIVILIIVTACRQQPTTTATTDPGSVTTTPHSTALPVTTPSPPLPTDTPTLTRTPTPEATSTVTPTPTLSPSPTAAPLPVSEEITFELVAQQGGIVHTVAVAGNRVYVGAGPRVLALDVANPVAPRVFARSDPLPGPVEALLAVQNGAIVQLYAGAGESLVTLTHDGTDTLLTQDTLPLPGFVSSVALAEGMLFAGGAPPGAQYPHGGFLALVDIRQPNTLTLSQTTQTANHVSALAYAHNILYSAHLGFTGPRLMATTIEQGQMTTPETLRGIENELYTLHLIGDTLLAGGYGTLLALDIATPDAPKLLWQTESIDDYPLGMINGIAHAAGHLYLSGWQPAGAYLPFRIVYTPPEPLTGVPALPAANDVIAAGSRLYIAENRRLEIHDISQPARLTALGSYKSDFIAVSDLAASGDDTLFLYNASPFDDDPETLLAYAFPTLDRLGHYTVEETEEERRVGGRTTFRLALDEESAYLATAAGIVHLDIANPATPRLLSLMPFTMEWLNSRALVTHNGLLYHGIDTDVCPSQIHAITFADNDPRQVAVIDHLQGSGLAALAVEDQMLYVLTSDQTERAWLHVLHLQDGGEMEVPSTLPLGAYPHSVIAVQDGLLAAALQDDRLLLIDVTAHQSPDIVASVILPALYDGQWPVADLAFHNDILFVAHYGQRVLAVDVSDATQPQVIGILTLPSTRVVPPIRLLIVDDHLVVASEAIGIHVYDPQRP